jgi:hypothetical protein
MTDFLVQTGATIVCPHGGQVAGIPSSNVLLDGQPVLTQTDTFIVAECSFTIPTPAGPVPHPCIQARWLVPSLRVRVNGQAVILRTSTGICQAADQAPQGPPSVIATQVQVGGE